MPPKKFRDVILNVFQSKSLWGLLIFMGAAMTLVYMNKFNTEISQFFQWAGGAFFGSRAVDNLSNINIVRQSASAQVVHDDSAETPRASAKPSRKKKIVETEPSDHEE